MQKSYRSLLLNLTLILISGFLGLVITEAVLRLVGLDFARFWEPDRELGWRHVPGATRHFTDEGDAVVTVNRLGQRDEERQLEKAPGTFRIAVFGDSLTEATQVDLRETFPQILEEDLTTSDRPVEVLNFGVSGYSPVQYLLSLKRNGPLYRPDLVILAIFVDNDVAGVHPRLNPSSGAAPYARFDRSGPVQDEILGFDFSDTVKAAADYERQPIHFVREVSAIYRFLSDWRTRLRAAGRARAASGASGSIPKRFLLYHEKPEPEWEEAWDTFEKVLVELKRECERQGVGVLFVYVPAAQVVRTEGWEAILAAEPAMAGVRWRLTGPEERLAAIAAEHGLPLLEPQEAFRQASPASPLYFGNTGHMTAAGHKLMAELINKDLQARGLLGSENVLTGVVSLPK